MTMNIQSAQWLEDETTSNACAVRLVTDSGEWSVPLCPGNRFYDAFQAWLAEGNTPDPAPEPPAPVEPTAEEKLAASGLTLDDLAHLLDSTTRR